MAFSSFEVQSKPMFGTVYTRFHRRKRNCTHLYVSAEPPVAGDEEDGHDHVSHDEVGTGVDAAPGGAAAGASSSARAPRREEGGAAVAAFRLHYDALNVKTAPLLGLA